MSPANPVPDASTQDLPQRPRLYTPGLPDPLGDRMLTFDNSTASSLELLRFKKEFSSAPGFESALRKRVDDLSRLRHPSIAAVRGVEWLNSGEALALVSIHTAGRRLSEILKDARGAAFALELVRQVAPALVALENTGTGLSHGALTPERIVVTREGRLVVVEHVLASAIEALRLPANRVRADLGLAVPASDPVKFDARLDVIQLAFVALSLLLGRRLEAADYPQHTTVLLDEFARNDAAAAARFRPWLERALQLGANPFSTAQEAQEAFNKLPAEDAAPVSVATSAAPAAAKAPVAVAVAAPARNAALKLEPIEDLAPAAVASAPTQWHSGRAFKIARWVAGALAVLAVGEGMVIAGLFTRPSAVVVAPPPPSRAQLMPTQPAAVINIPVPTTTPAAAEPAASTSKPAEPPPAAKPDVPPADKPAAAPASSTSRFGGIKLSSAIELQVFENNNLLGSTAGPIAVNEGAHALDLVNELLGFRTRQTVTVKSGQMTNLTVPVPDGRVSINAVPWADVVIDGTPAGQTPIANLSLKIGQHEVIFRHPQLGEQKQTVTVKVDGLTRVSAVLQK
ncbi:MAG TPA: PEGA domain-containing protein [Vicinamibacterales bacterium]|nr:PEGA domain-containing protein [Vicinamibacterales bacterium]